MHYIALVWDETDATAREDARRLKLRSHARTPPWNLLLELPGFAIYWESRADQERFDRAYVLHGQQGVVLGRLFRRGAEHASEAAADFLGELSEPRTRAIAQSGGRALTSDYWGRYVAFVLDSARRGVSIVRDPSGGVPCQCARIGGVHAYFARFADFRWLDGRAFDVNQHYLLGYLLYDSACVRETAVAGIETVLPGELIEHTVKGRSRSFCWNPLEISQRDVIEDFDEAVLAMRSAVATSIHSWASCFEGIALNLSGGLDSSIVLACLAKAPSRPKLLAQHNYSSSGDMDERSYARSAAASVGCALQEILLDPRFDLPPVERAGEVLSPFPQVHDETAELQDAVFAQSEGIGARFGGDGGDEVFYRSGALPSAVDFAWRHRLSPRLLSVAAGDAVQLRTSIWRILRMARHYGWSRRAWRLSDSMPMNRLPLVTDMVKQAARDDFSFWHPLYQTASPIEPCKFVHAYLLTFGSDSMHLPRAAANPPAYIAPLRSQPVMEISLRTPAYVLTTGGRDRAVARAAFADCLPLRIANRRSKGTGNAFLESVIARHIAHVRELLLDGYLVESGILDRARTERVLAGKLTALATNVMELLTYLDIERWIAGWRGAQSARLIESVMKEAAR